MMSGPRAKKFTSGWALPMGSWGKAHFYERDGVSAVQSLCGALSPFPAGYPDGSRGLATLQELRAQASGSQARGMTERYPFPDIVDRPFPPEIPWDRPISELSGWWLEYRTGNNVGAYPLRLLAAQMGWNATLRQIVPRIIAKRNPDELYLVDTPQGEGGRHGAKAKRLSLLG